MGMIISYMERLKEEDFSSQTLNFVMGSLYKQFVDKDIKDFEGFQLAVLDLFNQVNMKVPGMHYDPPKTDQSNTKKLEEWYNKWKATKDDEKRNIFKDFMIENVQLNKSDKSEVITGMVAPLGAIAVKRTGKIVPQLRFVKLIPDFFFVPSFTLVALIAVKISRIKLMKKVPNNNNPSSSNDA